MIKRYKAVLISVLALVAAVCLLAGCNLSINKSLDDFVNEKNLKATVTYVLNEGSFTDNSQVFEMYYSSGAKPYKITQSRPADATIGNALIEERNGYTFEGWYEAELVNGKPVYEDGTPFDPKAGIENGKAVKSTDREYDFTKPLEEGDNIYVVARWTTDTKLIVKLIADGFTLEKGEDKYVTGSVINSYPIPANGLSNMGKRVFVAQGYTFMNFYTDESASDLFTDWPVRVPEDEQDVVIYAKYIVGDWELISNADVLKSTLFRSGGGLKNYYFLNDVDCSGLSAQSTLSLFSGTIEGNGHTLKNLTVSASNLTNSSVASLFGDLRSTAAIQNINIENLTVNFTVRSNNDANAYFLFSSMDKDAKLENVTLSGQMNITLGDNAHVRNTKETNWMFGGMDNDSLVDGIKVIGGTKCVITSSTGEVTTYEYKES